MEGGNPVSGCTCTCAACSGESHDCLACMHEGGETCSCEGCQCPAMANPAPISPMPTEQPM